LPHRQRRKLRRESLDRELEEALRPVEVREGRVAEVAQFEPCGQVVPYEIRRGAREQHLAAVPGVPDSCGLVNGEADVAVAAEDRLAGVDPHAHPHRGILRPLVRGEGALCCAGGPHRRAGAAESREKGIPLGVDLDPARLGEGRAQQPVVRREHLAVAVAPQRLEQPRGALDVAEQERHRSRGQRSRRLRNHRHAQISTPSRLADQPEV
jgi:hypothetical protein